MAKRVLSIDFEVDYQLLAIVSSLPDYRMAWLLNQKLNFDFARNEDLLVIDNLQKIKKAFSLYSFEDLLNKSEYYLISNKQGGSSLLKELKQVDFLLKAKGAEHVLHIEALAKKINGLGQVQTCFQVATGQLKEKDKLFF